MTTISSPGIGSGLDTGGIVSKLMAVEAIPLNQLTTKANSYQTKLTAYGQVQSGLSAFQSSLFGLSNMNTLNTVSATSSDTSVLSATASATSQSGSYSISVSQLAQSQQLVSVGQATTTAAIGSGASTTVTFNFGTISGGTLSNGQYTGASFTSNGLASKSITIDSTNNTLGGIAGAINAAAMGVTASIINDGSSTPNRLLITNTQTGITQSMSISVSGDASVASLLTEDPTDVSNQNFTQTTSAQNASLTINGVPVSKTSNVVSDAISGVTMTLNKTNVGSTVNLNLTNNTSGLASSIRSFVDSYNSIKTSLDNLTSYDITSHSGADLYGESTIQTAQRQIKNIALSVLPSSSNGYTRLNDIGITFQKNGSLSIDSTKLNNAISTNYQGVAGLFAANGVSTDSLVKFTSSSSDTKQGSYAVSVATMPKQGSLTAGAPAGLTIGPSNNTLAVTLNGISTTLTLTNATYSSPANLAAAIQSQINGATSFSNINASINVSADANGVLSFTSNRYGAASVVALSGSAASTLLGGTSGTTSNGVDMVASINGAAALTSGQTILGPLGTNQSGLKLSVIGGTTGARGTVTYTQGVAYQLNNLFNSLTGTGGLITTRTTGLNNSIAQIEKQKSQMNVHLSMLQKQYQATYSALDKTIASLNSTSSYLTGQLSSIAATSNSIASGNK